MRKKLENALLELGITPNLAGFDYICRAVEIISGSKEKIKLVDGIYADIAKEFGTKPSRVERAIRHAIDKIDFESDAFAKYLNTTRLTNSILLYTLARKLKVD